MRRALERSGRNQCSVIGEATRGEGRMLLAAKAKKEEHRVARPPPVLFLSPALPERGQGQEHGPIWFARTWRRLELTIGGRKRSKGFNLCRFPAVEWALACFGQSPDSSSLPFRPLLLFPRVRRAAPIGSEVIPSEKDPSQEGN